MARFLNLEAREVNDNVSNSDTELSDEIPNMGGQQLLDVPNPRRIGNKHDEQMLKEVKKSNKLLEALLKRVDSTEDRLKLVEDKLNDLGQSASASAGDTTPLSRFRSRSRKRDVPDEVRVRIIMGGGYP